MKQIGINQFTGPPDIAQAMVEMTDYFKQKSSQRQSGIYNSTPAEAFWKLSRNDWNRPLSNSYPNYYRLEKYGLLELDRFIQEDYCVDIPNMNDWVIVLRSLMVVDLYQGKGIGRRILDKVKDLADETSCCVALYVHPFGLAKDGISRSGFCSFEELLTACLIEEWEVVYHPEYEMKSVAEFYKQAGFKNICFGIDKEHENPEAWKYYYIYVPPGLNYKYRESLQYRLNIESCEFCK